jgi:hypothetical protein
MLQQFLSAAMIDASVRFLQEWASPLTLVNYLLLALVLQYLGLLAERWFLLRRPTPRKICTIRNHFLMHFLLCHPSLRAPRIRPDTAHGLPRHYVPGKDGVICVTASEARQSMQPEVMDCVTLFAMTERVHGKPSAATQPSKAWVATLQPVLSQAKGWR